MQRRREIQGRPQRDARRQGSSRDPPDQLEIAYAAMSERYPTASVGVQSGRRDCVLAGVSQAEHIYVTLSIIQSVSTNRDGQKSESVRGGHRWRRIELSI